MHKIELFINNASEYLATATLASMSKNSHIIYIFIAKYVCIHRTLAIRQHGSGLYVEMVVVVCKL